MDWPITITVNLPNVKVLITDNLLLKRDSLIKVESPLVDFLQLIKVKNEVRLVFS